MRCVTFQCSAEPKGRAVDLDVDHPAQFCYTDPTAQPTRPGGVFRRGHAGLVTVSEGRLASTVNDTESVSDTELVAQAKEDPAAFGALYERYVNLIYTYIYYRVGNHQDAEDLTARTFFRALKHIGKYEDRGAPVSAWFYRIAHNLVANWHRDQGRHPVVSLEPTPLDDLPNSPETVAVINEEQERLLDVVRRLPSDRQQLLVLKFAGHMSNAEIGGIMERTEGAIKSLYHRTLIALRQEFTQLETSRDEREGEQ
jgi:RNA polymerase sigma-70 factor (ECF subfamily)